MGTTTPLAIRPARGSATTLRLPRAGSSLALRRAVRLPLPVVPGSLGRFLLLRELGHGAMATVYEALDRSGHRVALKLPLSDTGGIALRREVRALRRVGAHPDLVSLREVVSIQGRPALVLELVDGDPLDVLLARHPLAPIRASRALAAVARALEHIHAHGFVHRDVKPGNVIVRPDGQGVLMDLGLARACGDERSEGLAGTPTYMAAEQLCGADPSPAGDVFALGVSLHEALTGRVPHDAPGTADLLRLRCQRPIVHPGAAAPHIPARLDQLVVACLAPTPRARPSAGHVAAVLEELAPAPRARSQAVRVA